MCRVRACGVGACGIDRLVGANLIVRKGHGYFDVADPFVKQVWLRHVQMRESLIVESGQQGSGASPERHLPK